MAADAAEPARTGVCLGVDVGRARIGVARCDPHRMLATPLETVPRDSDGDEDLTRLLELVDETGACEIVVGLPRNLRGEHTPSTADAIAFAEALATRVRGGEGPGVLVRLVDERLSTVSAQAQFHAVGKNTKQSRRVIDQAAAVVILQHALDSDAAQGKRTGTIVAPADESEADR